MNTFRNNVFLTGIAGSDPRIFNLSGNKRVARLSIAINEVYKNSAGETVKNTQWFTLICWNKKVELVENIVHKGCRFSIEGKLSSSSYVDKKGEKKYSTEVIVSRIEVADREVELV